MEKILANELLPGGMRCVKVISDTEIDAARWLAAVPTQVRASVSVEASKDESLGVFYLSLVWPAREAVMFGFEPKPRRMLLQKILEGQRVSEAIRKAKDLFFDQTGFLPRLVFVRQLPQGAENGMDVHGVMLIQADWALEGCVILGGRDAG